MNSPTELSRVLVVDDHPGMLRQVAQLLSGEFEVVATLPDGRDLARMIEMRQPDVVVLDITLPWISGIDLASSLGRGKAAPRIVFLTVHDDIDYARAAFEAGAAAYVVKSRLASDLIPALHAALSGRRFVSPVSALVELQ